MKKMSFKSTIMLVLTAFIWGVAFVAQSVGMNYIGPFTFSCIRSLLGGVVLIPCIWFLDKWKAKNGEASEVKKTDVSEGEKASSHRRGVLWSGTLRGIEPAAVRGKIYNRRKSRIHHSTLYCYGSYFRTFLEKACGN